MLDILFIAVLALILLGFSYFIVYNWGKENGFQEGLDYYGSLKSDSAFPKKASMYKTEMHREMPTGSLYREDNRLRFTDPNNVECGYGVGDSSAGDSSGGSSSGGSSCGD